jgi:hypothetical protein
LKVLANRITISFFNKDGCTCIVLFFHLWAYSLIVYLLPIYITIGLARFEATSILNLYYVNKASTRINPFLNPCILASCETSQAIFEEMDEHPVIVYDLRYFVAIWPQMCIREFQPHVLDKLWYSKLLGYLYIWYQAYLDANHLNTWSSNPHAKTPITKKPSKLVIGVWHKDNLYMDMSTIGNGNPHLTNIDLWTISIRMTPRSQLFFDMSFFSSLENEGREIISPTHTQSATNKKFH